MILFPQIAEKSHNNLKIAESVTHKDKNVNVIYAETATQLFESIANVVEVRQPLIETYFGSGKLFSLMKILQKECDRQARQILEKFKLKRDFDSVVRASERFLLFVNCRRFTWIIVTVLLCIGIMSFSKF